MKSLIKYTTFLLAVFFIVGFAPTLSAKGHRHHCSTSFSFNLLSLLPVAPVVPVYREYHYVERPTYYISALLAIMNVLLSTNVLTEKLSSSKEILTTTGVIN